MAQSAVQCEIEPMRNVIYRVDRRIVQTEKMADRTQKPNHLLVCQKS